jgi:hypothetical protein
MNDVRHKVALALRSAGYKPLPRWWVRAEDFELVEYMVKQCADEVTRIRREANNAPLSREEQIELAWKRHQP